ncbi:hypothetical protein BDF22DRAFT_620272 [Syncephalis plumigaleata]|nr:hypothetical protein BDF22DRAFT_620272 [Syncephalis plumigaleata]
MTNEHTPSAESSLPETTGQLLGLPAITSEHSSNSNNNSVRLEELGPVVINEDGSISRINNWREMSEHEKKVLERVLLKRNAQRLALLRSQDAEEATTTSEQHHES